MCPSATATSARTSAWSSRGWRSPCFRAWVASACPTRSARCRSETPRRSATSTPSGAARALTTMCGGMCRSSSCRSSLAGADPKLPVLDLDHVTVVQLTAPAGLDAAVDDHRLGAEQVLAIATCFDHTAQLQQLAEADRVTGDLDLLHVQRGAMRIAPSRRITSPFSIVLVTMCSTRSAYSSGRARRGGNGTCAPSEARTSSDSEASIGVSKMPGAMVITRTPLEESSRATGSVRPTTPPLEAEYATWPI